MLYSYCRSCKQESPGDTCPLCGKRASPAAMRDVWSVTLLPVSDSRAWLSALYVLLAVAGLLMLLIFGLETLLSGAEKATNLWQGGLPSVILSVIPVGLLIAGVFLLLQGKEVAVYFLDPKGAHLQTWHTPSRLKSWARLQSADPEKDVPQPSGEVMHLSQERHLMWADVQSVKYAPRNASIFIFHTPRCAPLALRLPQEEYELAAKYVGKYCKNK